MGHPHNWVLQSYRMQWESSLDIALEWFSGFVKWAKTGGEKNSMLSFIICAICLYWEPWKNKPCIEINDFWGEGGSSVMWKEMKASLVKSIPFCRFDFGTMKMIYIIIKLTYETKCKKQSLRVENKRKQTQLCIELAA